jgi:hypothetical protein
VAETVTPGEERCAKCHIVRLEWEHNGQGYNSGGQTYCCRGCSEGTGCTCHQALA